MNKTKCKRKFQTQCLPTLAEKHVSRESTKTYVEDSKVKVQRRKIAALQVLQ